jgi:hypothetical protein
MLRTLLLIALTASSGCFDYDAYRAANGTIRVDISGVDPGAEWLKVTLLRYREGVGSIIAIRRPLQDADGRWGEPVSVFFGGDLAAGEAVFYDIAAETGEGNVRQQVALSDRFTLGAERTVIPLDMRASIAIDAGPATHPDAAVTPAADAGSAADAGAALDAGASDGG